MDLEFFRRDEIWLVDLDDNRASTLAPLLRSSPRKHEMIEKNYLRGRYGAIPHISVEPLPAWAAPEGQSDGDIADARGLAS